MMTNQLLRELVQLFEISNSEVSSGDGQYTRGIPAWRLRRYASINGQQSSNWFTLVGYADYCIAPCYDEDVEVVVEYDDELGGYGYRCPETFKWRRIAEENLAIYEPKTDRLLHAIADIIDIPQAFRGGIEKPVIENLLWKLGKIRIGRADIDVWMCKRFCQNLGVVYDYLERPAIPELGILLTCGGPIADMLRRPKRFHIVRLLDMLPTNSDTAAIDQTIIALLTTRSETAVLDSSCPVNFNELTNTLTLHNHPEPWVIKGPLQIKAIRYMAEQAIKGRWDLPAGEILNAVYGTQKVGRSRRMQDLFKSNAQWRSYITNRENGIWGFVT